MQRRPSVVSLCVAALCACSQLSSAQAEEPPKPTAAEVGKLMLSAELWTVEEINATARFVDASKYVFIPTNLGPVMYESGNPMLQLGADYGKTLNVGETTRRGVFWNFSQDPARVQLGNGVSTVELPPHSILVLGNVLKKADQNASIPGAVIGAEGEELVSVESTVSVTCGAGYFACCKTNSGGSSMTANCVQNDIAHMPLCDAGGPGATECSISD